MVAVCCLVEIHLGHCGHWESHVECISRCLELILRNGVREGRGACEAAVGRKVGPLEMGAESEAGSWQVCYSAVDESRGLNLEREVKVFS